jgi:hypothetical protein
VNAHRAPALVLLVALLVGALTLGVEAPDGVGEAPPAVARTAMSLAGESSDLWFCIGPTAALDGIRDRSVQVASIAAGPVDGRVIVVDERGRVVERAFRLDAGDRLEIRPGRFVPGSAFAAVTVEVPGGAVVVGQRVEGDGVDQRPCLTRTSGTWLVPWSTTARPGNRVWLLLHNPFPASAVVDLRFVGDIGRRETLDSQGMVVAGRSMVAYDVTERISDSSVVSALVRVRVGQVVVARLQLANGAGPSGIRGLDLAPGLPEARSRLFVSGVGPVAGSTDGSGGDLSVVVLNPGEETIELEVVARTSPSDGFVEPWPVVLRAGQRHVVDLGDGRLDGVGTFSIEVRTLDDQPVAASLVRRGAVTSDRQTGGGDQATDDQPVGDRVDVPDLDVPDLAVRPLTAVAARGWLVDLGERFESSGDILAVANPSGSSIATIEVKVLAGRAPEGLPAVVELGPGAQVVFPLGAGGPVILAVESTSGVVASVRESSPSGSTAGVAVAVAGTEEWPESG